MNEELKKLYLKVLDYYTLQTLNKLSSSGYFDELLFPISEGKEAVVFLASSRDRRYVAIKVYRVNMATFKHIRKYIEGDPRFRTGKRRTTVIFQWVRKEFRNLVKAWKVGVRVPEPITFSKNVLIMEFIGENGTPAPTAKDKPPRNPYTWFNTITNWIRILYKEAKLVHADLNEYNILNMKEKPVIIDWGQAVTLDHERALELLYRDIERIFSFFQKLGVNTGDPLNLYSEMIHDEIL